MIALTQEKREELANYARARLASHVVHGGCSDEEDIFKIALALLTSPPLFELKLPSNSDFDSWFKSVEAGDDTGWQEPAYQSVEWYQYLGRRQLAKGVFNFYADEIKRLNGWGE
ncbi:hypothetical protein AI29_15045 [bacteria symbiont BFo2 of Frankliniella occidentalis]|nr:hypothetical protein AI29_15045 [bacteria symbiont BFo2 of Frankliniella occidentalis]KYP93555.1 hypothetical protein WB67_13090 [bacteria symbiont BFo2 of Frankliniella occidentalis]